MIVKTKTIVTTKDWFNLCVFGDWHYGSLDCDTNKLNAAIDFLASKKRDSYGVLLVGDLMENVVLGSKGSSYELSVPDPKNQKKDCIKMVRKFKNTLLCAVEGNHELRTRKRTGQNLIEDIIGNVYGSEADEYYIGLNGLIILQFKTPKGKLLSKYNIFVTHGTGNATTLSGKTTKIHALRDRADADIYVQGHLHHKIGFADYMYKNGILHKRVFLCCSSYLVEAAYAQEFGFKPTDYGVNKISLSTKTSEMIGYF